MRRLRLICVVALATIAIVAMLADWIAPHDYAQQYREHANERPSREFPLGTDEVGRDRFSRLLHASRTSLLLAPATALLATFIATITGVIAGYRRGWTDNLISAGIDLVLSLPWLFVLLILRALLPLNVLPAVSMTATALFIACVGWAPAARIIRAEVIRLRQSAPILQATASGLHHARLLYAHMLPNLKPVLRAQFGIFVPVFLLTEANLGLLGLGIAEPMPSLGSMLAELQNYQRIPEAPWILGPAILLVAIVTSLHLILSGATAWE
jgi:peptide/nickel transport system permease protein